MVPPIESQKRLLYFIRAYGEVTMGQIREFVRKCELDFGLGVGTIDVLVSDQALGKIEIDIDKGRARSLEFKDS